MSVNGVEQVLLVNVDCAEKWFNGDFGDILPSLLLPQVSLLHRALVAHLKGTYDNEQCEKDHQTGEECRHCDVFFALFGSNGLEDQQKRLRANVRALNQAFAAAMRQYGKTKVEIGAERIIVPMNHSLDMVSQEHGERVQRFQPHGTAEYYEHAAPEPQVRQEYEIWVRNNMDRWISMGPGGEPSDAAYAGLFGHQAQRWGKIASQHVQAVWLVVQKFVDLALEASCADRYVLLSLRQKLVKPNILKLQEKADRALRDLVSCHSRPNPGFYDSFADTRAAREHAKALLQRIAAMRPESEDNTEGTGSRTASSTEHTDVQLGSPQQANGQRHGESKAKAQQVGSSRTGEQKNKARNEKTREAFIAAALQNTVDLFGGKYPFVSSMIRDTAVPIIAHQISMAFEPSSDSGGKEKGKRTETSIQKMVQDLYPSGFGDLSAARIIEHVDMHYEGIRASFVGYVSSLVVEQKIMGQLSEKIFTMALIRGVDVDILEDIAGEKPEDAKKRKMIEEDLSTMREVLQTMEEYIEAIDRLVR